MPDSDYGQGCKLIVVAACYLVVKTGRKKIHYCKACAKFRVIFAKVNRLYHSLTLGHFTDGETRIKAGG